MFTMIESYNSKEYFANHDIGYSAGIRDAIANKEPVTNFIGEPDGIMTGYRQGYGIGLEKRLRRLSAANEWHGKYQKMIEKGLVKY